MKLIVPCNSLVKKPKVHCVVLELNHGNVKFILDKMDFIQKIHLDDQMIEGLVIHGMNAEFLNTENDVRTMISIEKGKIEGERVLASSMNMIILPGWFYFSGIPEFSDVTYESISVHRFFMEGLKGKM